MKWPLKKNSNVDVDEVLEKVADIISEVVGTENLGDSGIDMKTSFQADLQVNSIDIIVIGERLKEEYEQELHLDKWLGGMTIDNAIRLTVGDLVEHVAKCL